MNMRAGYPQIVLCYERQICDVGGTTENEFAKQDTNICR